MSRRSEPPFRTPLWGTVIHTSAPALLVLRPCFYLRLRKSQSRVWRKYQDPEILSTKISSTKTAVSWPPNRKQETEKSKRDAKTAKRPKRTRQQFIWPFHYSSNQLFVHLFSVSVHDLNVSFMISKQTSN